MPQMFIELKELVWGQPDSFSGDGMIKRGLDGLYIWRRKVLRRWYLRALSQCERRGLNR
ncbi:MAG: hypothetical protein ACXV7J_05155 [Methylomonas sp.]